MHVDLVVKIGIPVFMRPCEVWFAYCYRKVCLFLFCLSVTLVNCGQTVTDRPIVTMGDKYEPTPN